MFGIGGTELVIILIFAFLIFGPDQLPKIGRTVGRAMRQFKQAQDEMSEIIKKEVYDPNDDTSPLKNPFEGVFETEDTKSKPATSTQEKAAEDKEPLEHQETFAERKARLALERAEASARSSAPSPSVAEQLYGLDGKDE